MNRRNLLQGLATLPLMGALSSCRRHEAPAKGRLKVYLHGPFAVVVNNNDRNRITAFVPSDPTKQHRFIFNSLTANDESQDRSYRFVLGDRGLEITERPPYIDRGFDDFYLHRSGGWREPEKYFVSIDLPAPEVITFIPPAEGVLFKDGRTGMMPIEHILEYPMRDVGEVRLHSEELGDHAPLNCSDLVREYHKHWEQSPYHQKQPPTQPQRGSIEEELSRCSTSDVAAYFFGVGLPENKYSDPYMVSHAVTFFNDVLLPSFPNAPDRDRLTLEHILGYGFPCPPPGTTRDLPKPAPTVFRSSGARPRFLTVAEVDDCKLGGLIAIHPGPG